MNKEMLNFCMEKGILLDKQILDLLDDFNNVNLAKNFLERIEYQYKQKIITQSFFENNYGKIQELLLNYSGQNKKIVENFFNNLGLNIEEVNEIREIELSEKKKSNFEIIYDYEVKPRKLEVKDFVNNFRNRFSAIKGFLQGRVELDNLVSINKISKGNSCSVIVIVADKKITKNGNLLLQVEDLTGRVTALINKDKKEVFEKSKEVLLDDVIALKCSGDSDILFVNDIIFPDIIMNKKKKSTVDESIAFISDIHLGSNRFLKKNFLKFVNWINGEGGDQKQRKEALKVKYLFITGDPVDGVGIFPEQEKELDICDIHEQYRQLAELLVKIRSDVQIIMCPGQHDAVRIAEPQPSVPEQYASEIHMIKNLKLVSNPCLVEVGSNVKFKVLMYHGASMHGIINNIEALRLGKAHDSPTSVVKYMLKKRHLAPSHSLTTYTPLEEKDALMIDEVPDILATGDLHRPEVSNYNGVMLIASSCWQSRTPFEEKVGNNPDPAKVPIFNLKTREVKIIDFSSGLDEHGHPVEGWEKYRGGEDEQN